MNGSLSVQTNAGPRELFFVLDPSMVPAKKNRKLIRWTTEDASKTF